jgi:hypothetical protein
MDSVFVDGLEGVRFPPWFFWSYALWPPVSLLLRGALGIPAKP